MGRVGAGEAESSTNTMTILALSSFDCATHLQKTHIQFYWSNPAPFPYYIRESINQPEITPAS